MPNQMSKTVVGFYLYSEQQTMSIESLLNAVRVKYMYKGSESIHLLSLTYYNHC